MHKTSTIQKIALIIFGLFLTIILIETSMRTAGFILTSLQEYRNALSAKKTGTYRILCLGESTTGLGGSNAYPSQLERILNAKNTGLTFSVINKGMPDKTTSYILKQLDNILEEYKPNLVTAMMGINDNKDEDGYWDDYWAENINYWAEYTNNINNNKPTSFLKSLKTYKLAKFIRSLFINKKTVSKTSKQPEYETIRREHLEETIASKRRKQSLEMLQGKYPTDFVERLKSGWRYFDQHNFEKSEEIFENAVEKNQNNYYAYSNLAEFYCVREEYDEAKEVLKKVFELKPEDINLDYSQTQCYLDLNKQQINTKDLATAEDIWQSVYKNNTGDPEITGRLANIYSLQGKADYSKQYFKHTNELITENLNPLTVYNYQKLQNILMKRGIKLVVVQYPMLSIKPLLKTFRNKRGIVFVDNEQVFKDVTGKQNYNEYFTDIFAGAFGHCTAKGNKLLAENIAEVISKEVFNYKKNN